MHQFFNTLLLILACQTLVAGGGPEAVALVVNVNDDASKEVANYYAHLRQIPEINVIYLENVPQQNTISLEDFRTTILLPIFAQLKQRGIDRQIDYITYSCGFPTRVQFDRAHAQRMPYIANPFASLTGMTYLFQITLKDDQAFLAPRTNLYFRQTTYASNVKGAIQSAPNELLKDVYVFFNEKNKRARQRQKDKQAISDADKKWETLQWRKALDILKTVCADYPRDPSLWYNRACAEAQNDHLDAAMQALQQAVAAGHVDWQHTKSDSDLTALHERDDFKALIEQMKNIEVNVADSHGFSAQYAFNKDGDIVGPQQGMHYVISTMLGYTGERGNTIPEIKQYLQRAASADGSKPKGHVYFPLNGDIRSRTREWAVRSAVKQLQNMGVSASHPRGTVPHGKHDIIGAGVGIATFDLEKSNCQLLPGAIAEHLTSWGAEFERAGQTKISAWLRAGAAGSSGTISEPYALQFKFPNAFLYLHYARGCTLGEAFYQSVESPYELLILGDALCKPWAEVYTPQIQGIANDQTILAKTEIKLSQSDKAKYFVAMLNGRIIGKATSNQTITLNPDIATPGFYELRIVTIDPTAIENRNFCTHTIHIGKEKLFTKASIKAEEGKRIRIDFSSTEDERFAACVLMQHGRIIARHANPAGHFIVERSHIGAGPIQVRLALLNEAQKVFYLGPQLTLNE